MPGAEIWGAMMNGGFYFLLVGLPLAYGVELTVGLPLYRFLRRRGRLTGGRIVSVAALSGAALFSAVSGAWASAAAADWFIAIAAGAVGGGVAGAAFWGVGIAGSAARSAA